MKIERDTAAAFTGHRTYEGQRDDELCVAVRRLHARGVRTFLTGMAAGFDLAAGECVVRLRDELEGLRLVCVVPFAGHERSLHGSLRGRYDAVLAAADSVIVLAQSYHPRAYHVRNDYLVDNSSFVVAYYDGSDGGTQYTVRKALREGLAVENLYCYRVARHAADAGDRSSELFG